MFLFKKKQKTYYEVLEISPKATDAEIKRAYFNMVRTYQPDRFPEEFKEIRAAYETLSDKQKRAEYDAIGKLPASVAPLFHEARRLDSLGKHNEAADLYEFILKRHPELENVRKEYAFSLSADDKNGKAADVWKELCRRHPDNAQYARKLGQCYLDRGWHKKALTEVQRALVLDPSSIHGWSLHVSCIIAKGGPGMFDELQEISNEALEAVKEVKTNEWEKIYLYAHAFITSGISKVENARGHLQQIIRLIREGGQNGRSEGRQALHEIALFVPDDSLAALYPELKEMADLLPDLNQPMLDQLENIRINFEAQHLLEKNYHEIFRDLFVILNTAYEDRDEDDELELLAIEFNLLRDKKLYDPQIRRLREEFPELYALHASFFNTALRTRDPEKMLYQLSKKIKKLKNQLDIDEDEDEDEDEDQDEDQDYGPPKTVHRAQPKVGRNDPCPCGSGKKYKHCCGA
ncbi:MAG: DnaJ domain-containing protein [Treponema sp.]|nr:DnaJ domain-containing protein [Treponema sp.]